MPEVEVLLPCREARREAPSKDVFQQPCREAPLQEVRLASWEVPVAPLQEGLRPLAC